MEAPAKGTILAGKYALGLKLGEGGMGSVWAAEHLTLRSKVAIKLINPQFASHPVAHTRFLREARAAAGLRTPYVVKILDHGIDDDTPYIVMELLEGESLATRIRRLGKLAPAETASLLGNVAHAMAKAHEAGIVHRDLKPDNIFIVTTEEEEIAKVLDFGVAKIIGSGTAPSGMGTRTGAAIGTPYYMSPEQAEGTKRVDYRSDLWALGATAYECLLGRRAFESDGFSWVLAICSRPLPIPSECGEVPPGFDAWFARACARDPDERFTSAKAQAAELLRICGVGRMPLPSEPVYDLLPSVSVSEAPEIEASPTISAPATTTMPLSTNPKGSRRQGPFRTLAPYLVGGALATALLVSYATRENVDGDKTSPVGGSSPGAAGLSAPFAPPTAQSTAVAEMSASAVPASSTVPPGVSSAQPPSTPPHRRVTDLPIETEARSPQVGKTPPRPREPAATMDAAGSSPAAPTAPDASINLGI